MSVTGFGRTDASDRLIATFRCLVSRKPLSWRFMLFSRPTARGVQTSSPAVSPEALKRAFCVLHLPSVVPLPTNQARVFY